MPTASDEQRDLMQKWFGDGIDEQGPMAFLISRGYMLTRGWEWVKPVSAHTISDEEWQCIAFLCDEWDFGGIANLTSCPTCGGQGGIGWDPCTDCLGTGEMPDNTLHVFEIWQNGAMVASVSAADYESASTEAMRYLMAYAADGPAELRGVDGTDVTNLCERLPDFGFRDVGGNMMIGDLK